MSMLFSSREDAGRELGAWLSGRGIKPDIVLGLPRGGVPVAAQVAAILQCPLDVLVVRKIGHPRQREFAVGALAEPDVVLLDSHSAQSTHAAGDDLRKVIEEETGRLREYLAKFHRGSPLTLEGKIVLIIDDGVATGATAEAAIIAARKLGAASVLAA